MNDCINMRATGSVTIADIRDEQSFNQGHIEGAFRVDAHNISDFIQQADLDRPLIVCCYHGHSSIGAANFLEQQGFEDVYSMNGGMCEWGLTQETI